MKKIILSFLVLFTNISFTQSSSAEDSVKSTFKQLAEICRSVDFSDPLTTELGAFYKAAPYIVYTGNDKSRKWKDTCNYKNVLERRMVNEACYRINETVNQSEDFKFGKFLTETESEGTWYAIEVIYNKKGKEKKNLFAFLKVHGRFVLGDID
ncbi:MAG TPA: hypothetical protein VKA26_11220 [Ignavibacteriaceae bacterium]|nr:hypothetical protein [Ignavibacteriaceae bacterium]